MTRKRTKQASSQLPPGTPNLVHIKPGDKVVVELSPGHEMPVLMLLHAEVVGTEQGPALTVSPISFTDDPPILLMCNAIMSQWQRELSMHEAAQSALATAGFSLPPGALQTYELRKRAQQQQPPTPDLQTDD